MGSGSCAVAGFLCELVTDAGTPHAGFSSKQIRAGALGENAKRLIAGGQVQAGNPDFFKPIFYEKQKRVATGAWVKFVYHETSARSHIIKYVLFLEPPSATDLADFQTAVGVGLRVAEGNWSWRVRWPQLTAEVAQRLQRLTELARRSGGRPAATIEP